MAGTTPPAQETSGLSPATQRPGRTLGIVAFILAFFAQPIALILGIVALVMSRRAGRRNGFAIAAIILSAVLIVIAIVIIVIVATAANDAVQACSQNGFSGTRA